jgi:hypothetical protein
VNQEDAAAAVLSKVLVERRAAYWASLNDTLGGHSRMASGKWRIPVANWVAAEGEAC